MNAKHLAHDIQQDLGKITGLDPKRSHIYELIAAAFGAASYAALCAEGLLCPLPRAAANAHHARLRPTDVAARAHALQFPRVMADRIANDVCAAIRQAGIGLVPLNLILDHLLNGRNTLYSADLASAPEDGTEASGGADDLDDDDEEAWRARWRAEEESMVELGSPEIVEALSAAASRDDGRAHLALALLPEAEPQDGEIEHAWTDGRYWHERREAGEVVTGVEKEWADAYAQRAESRRSSRQHLQRAADLGQHDALLLMADRYGDTRFFELEDPQVRAHPRWVADVADNLGHYDLAIGWLEVAAAMGDVEAMRDLIEQRQADDPLKCWTWYHLARLHGTDLTKDNYRAVHEDGSAYDDDVGGALFAVGRDGVTLPPSNEDVRDQAQGLAVELFGRAAAASVTQGSE